MILESLLAGPPVGVVHGHEVKGLLMDTRNPWCWWVLVEVCFPSTRRRPPELGEDNSGRLAVQTRSLTEAGSEAGKTYSIAVSHVRGFYEHFGKIKKKHHITNIIS